jgi:hypothetical protein
VPLRASPRNGLNLLSQTNFVTRNIEIEVIIPDLLECGDMGVFIHFLPDISTLVAKSKNGAP